MLPGRGLTAASTSLLPPVVELPTEVVYLATALLITSANFLLFRHRIFHAKAIGAPLLELEREL